MKHFLSLILLFASTTMHAVVDTAAFALLPCPQRVEWTTQPAIAGGTTMDSLRIKTLITRRGVPAHNQGYVLSVRPEGVTIKARTEVGVHYARTTLRQLLDDARDRGCDVPQVTITDWPAQDYRAVHIDVKNHLDRMEYYYDLIDRLDYYKINGIIWELEDKLHYDRRPEISVQGAISKEAMRRLAEYAHQRYIDISPLVQGIGHAAFILKWHPELRENPASDWDMCPLNDSTYALQFDLYRDALEAMPYARFLHVGGDETQGLGTCSRCKASGKSAFELQMMWLARVCRYAQDAGVRPIFWDDMPLKHAGVFRATRDATLTPEQQQAMWNEAALDEGLKLYPKNCIFMRWLYDRTDLPGHLRVLNWYASRHVNVITATAASKGTQGLPRHHARLGYIRQFHRVARGLPFMGMLATAWDDGSPHMETVVRGFIGHAALGWNPDAPDSAALDEATAQREYGLPAGTHSLAFVDCLEAAFNFFDQALVSQGHRTPAYGNRNFTLIDLPNPAQPGAWSRKYAARLTRARQLARSYDDLQRAILACRDQALRHGYVFEVYRVLNRQQNLTVRLLLALQTYDQQPSAQTWQRVLNVCDEFAAMRADLEATFARTRVMTTPAGYKMDMNVTGMLARLTANDDWMFLYELPMIEKIRAARR